MSEFLRNLIVYAMHMENNAKVQPDKTLYRIYRTRNEWRPIKKPEERGLIGYGNIHAELMQQLKQVLAIRRKRMMGDNDAGLGEREKNNTKEP